MVAERYEEAETAYQALKLEVDKAYKELRVVENQLEQYYQKSNMLLAFEKDKVQVTARFALKASIVETAAEQAEVEETLKEINRQLTIEEKQAVATRITIKNSARVMLRDQIVQLKVALEQTKIRFHQDTPEVAEIEAQ